VNANEGNKKFRALCFARKTEFDTGNHAAKRRIATEIVDFCITNHGSRFYKKMTTTTTKTATSTAAAAAAKKAASSSSTCSSNNNDCSGWYEMTREQALLKACQVMRDHLRPDRIAQRESMEASGCAKKKRNRAAPSTPVSSQDFCCVTQITLCEETSTVGAVVPHIYAAIILFRVSIQTKMDDVPVFPAKVAMDTPEGVHVHDVLCGRGAVRREHIGMKYIALLLLLYTLPRS
jgi:hypothetical protein